jgi:FMN phosphatase YigB (HAD superfamily)
MSRPLVICDCDEVVLRMVAHFKDWLGESHGVEFNLQGNDFATALRRRETGELLDKREIWGLLGGFFDSEMHRQDPIAGAVQGLNALAEHADVVILTNIPDERQVHRAQQLAAHGVHARVFTNHGPKGPALRAILDEYRPSKAIFIDDLAQHHKSAAEVAPELIRLHLCGEPSLAPHIDCAHQAGHAHARIDTWEEALPWLLAQLQEEQV